MKRIGLVLRLLVMLAVLLSGLLWPSGTALAIKYCGLTSCSTLPGGTPCVCDASCCGCSFGTVTTCQDCYSLQCPQ